MEGLSIAGAEYERENEKDIIERRQYGVDGDRRANHDGPLPPPFNSERPRLGTRLYVRGCARRFMKPLVAELTNWSARSRLASAKLLRTVVIYCEESLTEQLHTLLPDIAHAFKVFDAESDKTSGEVAAVLTEVTSPLLPPLLSSISQTLTESSPSAPLSILTSSLRAHTHPTTQVCELMGRFIAPDSFVPFLLPRLRGELEVVPNGTDGLSRALVLQVRFAECLHGVLVRSPYLLVVAPQK
jgi:hypothetical protein